MSRRRREGNPFTLFSFQDIITSVMGIILLAALLLAVELVTRTPSQATSAASAAVQTQISGQITLVRDDIAALQQELKSLQDDAFAAAGAITADSDFHEQVASDQLQRLGDELAKLTKHLEERNRELSRQEARGFERRRDRQRLEGLEAETKKVEEVIADLKKSNRLFFNPIPGFAKKPWLIDISAEFVAVGPLSEDSKIAMAPQHTFPDEEAFLAFAGGLSSQTDYFMILIRPSGIERFHEILEGLRARDFDLGFDVIGEDQSVFSGGP